MRLLALLLCLLPYRIVADVTAVDVELVLAVDVSRSMQPWELEIQRRGYAEALRSDAVWAAINRGYYRRIAVTYVEWAGHRAQRVVVPWTLIDMQDDARDIADQITARFEDGLRRTSISSAIEYGIAALEQNAFDGERRVIDISGDGPNNAGRPVTSARDQAVEKGITINGLPLMTYDPDGPFARWGIPDLDRYYLSCVIGGFGAFSIPVAEWDDFADAVKRKLVLEIGGLPAKIWKAQSTTSTYNCLIGEDIWRRNIGPLALP